MIVNGYENQTGKNMIVQEYVIGPWADLRGADLRWAYLTGAILPSGIRYEEYQKDPLAEICTEPEARERALSAWDKHTWKDCPMHAAFGWGRVEDAPEGKRLLVSQFVALFDGRHLVQVGEKT
jgi:hypothetical protein